MFSKPTPNSLNFSTWGELGTLTNKISNFSFKHFLKIAFNLIILLTLNILLFSVHQKFNFHLVCLCICNCDSLVNVKTIRLILSLVLIFLFCAKIALYFNEKPFSNSERCRRCFVFLKKNLQHECWSSRLLDVSILGIILIDLQSFFCVEIFAGEGLVNRWRRETSLSGSQKKQQQLYKLDLEKSRIRYFWSNTLSLPASVTRLSDLLNFGQLFKAVGNN